MTPTLIVLGFIALGVAIVAYATRHASAPSTAPHPDRDIARGEDSIAEDPAPDPFAHAPVLQTVPEPARETERHS